MEFIDLKAQYQSLKETIDENIHEVIENAHFIGGSQVTEFETRLADYVGRKHCISCGNGTDALQLAYMACGIGEGDAVFCPSMTFIASIEPACLLGATPIFCEIDKTSYNISPTSLEKQIRSVQQYRNLVPKAVVAVDFLGNPADIEAIGEICKKYNLYLIEDAAQAISARIGNRKCGSFGDIACTSFFPSKPLGCYGDGGAIFTDNDDSASLLKSLKSHGKGTNKYDNVRIGINSRLDALQAGILLAKLTIIEDEFWFRQEIAQRYDKALKGYLQIPKIQEGSISSYAQYCIIAKSSVQRKHIIRCLSEHGIPSLIYYPNPLHMLDAFKSYNLESFPNAEWYAECNLGLPFSPYLKKEDQEKVIDVLLNSI